MKKVFFTLLAATVLSLNLFSQHSSLHDTSLPTNIGSINEFPPLGDSDEPFGHAMQLSYVSDKECVSIQKNTFAVNSVFPTGAMNIYAGDFANGIYYVATSDFKLYTVDLINHSFSFVADISGYGSSPNPTGMTYHSPSGTMYFSTEDYLYSLNISTGVLTSIGQISSAGWLIIDIAINMQGDLYGIDIIADNLVQINKATGQGTIIGSLGVNANFAQGMDFDDVTGKLYWACYQGSGVGGIREVNLTTGNSTLVASTIGEYDAFVVGNGIVPPVPVNKYFILLLFGLLAGVIVYRFYRFSS